MYVEGIPNVKFIKMRKLTIFITAVCALFLIKLNDDPGTKVSIKPNNILLLLLSH